MDNVLINTVIITLIAGSIGIAVSERLKFPVIIVYFICGILLGPHGLGLINPQSLGEGLNVLITVSVSIILFEGGLSLDISKMMSVSLHLFRQILITIAITMPLSWLAARYIVGLPADIALVFASLTIVTGPTVIKPIIQHLPLRGHVKTFLNGESVIIDAVGAVLAIAVIEFFISQKVPGLTILDFVLSLFIGATTGAAFGIGVKLAFTKTTLVPMGSRSILTLGIVFCAFGVSEMLSPESGLMAVAVFGLVLGSIKYREKEKLLSFKEKITKIVISFLFILLSADFNITKLPDYLAPGSLVVLVIIAARFPAVFASTSGGLFSFRERLFMGWVGPRGIIALSVASIAAMKLQSAGMGNADTIEILVFMLISATVLLQGMSAGLVAKKLDILVQGDRDIIILGINPVTIGLALRWREYRNDVLFIDSNESACRLAEKDGFQYVHGNGLAPDTFEGIDVDRYSSVIAASPNNEINVLFCRFMKKNFGIPNQYVILTEKANQELSEVIQSEGIKTACVDLQAKKSTSFFDAIRDYFSRKIPVITDITVKNPAFLKNKPGEYPVPDNAFILFAVRKSRSCYIYHDGFRLENGDILYIVMHGGESSNLLSLISG